MGYTDLPLELPGFVRLTLKDVMAPLPDGNGMIILHTLYGTPKSFPVVCPLQDACSCIDIMEGRRSVTAYEDMYQNVAGNHVRLTRAELTERDGALYSSMLFENAVRIASDNPAHAINLAMALNGPLVVTEAAFDRIVDSSVAYGALKKYLGALFPLQVFGDTHSLRLLCEYIEESIPHGSIFEGHRA